MKTFRAGDREWNLAINVGAIKRVADICGANLADLHVGDPPLITRLATDIPLIGTVVWALCKPQADAAGVNDTAFAELLTGDALQAAYEAFTEEMISFFQSLRRTDSAEAIRKHLALVKAATNLATERVRALDVDTALSKALGESVGSSQASSG